MSVRSEAPHDTTNAKSRLSLAVLLAMATLGVSLCFFVISPFVPGLVWALSLAVVAWPLHRRISGWIHMPNIAAGVSTLIVAVVLLAPAAVLAWYVGSQVGERLQQAQQFIESDNLRTWLERFPPAARLFRPQPSAPR